MRISFKKALAIFAKLLLCVVASVSLAQEKKLLKFEDGDSLNVINAKIQNNGYSFTVSHNWVYDLSPEQKAKMFAGRHRSANRKSINVQIDPGPLAKYLGKKLPETFDWRSYNGHSYIGPVHDQGGIGSCYSFSACAAAEGVYNFAEGKFDSSCADFSESYIIWCLGSLPNYNSHFYGGDGADYEYCELLALTSDGSYPGKDGALNETDFPYQETAPADPSVYWGFSKTVFNSWYRVIPYDSTNNTEAIKTAISTFGVIDAAVYVGSAFQAYDHGVYEDTNTEPDASPDYYSTTNHAISLVGWDDSPAEGGEGCWILRNSWGESWGEDGYMRIRYRSAQVNSAPAYLVYNEPTASITVLSPEGGEIWGADATKKILWTVSGSIDTVKIDLYKNGVLDSTITNSTDNTGSYDWTIPADQTKGNDYKIKISTLDGTVSGESAANFTIGTDSVLIYKKTNNYFDNDGKSKAESYILCEFGSTEGVYGEVKEISYDKKNKTYIPAVDSAITFAANTAVTTVVANDFSVAKTGMVANGKIRETEIGLAAKANIASSLTGVYGSCSSADVWARSTGYSLKLDSKQTKSVNKSNPTLDNAVTTVQAYLESRGYVPED